MNKRGLLLIKVQIFLTKIYFLEKIVSERVYAPNRRVSTMEAALLKDKMNTFAFA
jgi:hypothetical protein